VRLRRPSLRFGLLALCLAACASPAGPAQLTGAVTYRERIALPAGAVVRVALLDVSLVDAPARVIAEQEIRPTHQVPIPFALEYDRAAIDPERRYGLRATISDADGRLLWINVTSHPAFREGALEAATILVQRVQEGAAPGGPRMRVYACDGLAFRVEVTPGRALLRLRGRSIDLPAAPSGSGAKYSDGSTTFWSKGNEALLTLDGVEHSGCRVQSKPGL